MNTIPEDRDAFAERLLALGADVRFVGGRTAVPHADGSLAILIDHDRGAEGARHCVTVCAGLPPPPEVGGLLCTLRKAEGGAVVARAVTDRMGRVRLDDLEQAEYRLCVESPPTFVIPAEVCARVASRLEGGGDASAERLLLEFETPDRRYRAALDEPTGGASGLLLRLELDLEPPLDLFAGTPRAATTPLAVDGVEFLPRVELADGAGQVVAAGFVGMRRGTRGRSVDTRLFGEARLDLLRVPLVPIQPGPLRLTLRPVGVESLRRGDRELLERSLVATTDPHSRTVLEGALLGVS